MKSSQENFFPPSSFLMKTEKFFSFFLIARWRFEFFVCAEMGAKEANGDKVYWPVKTTNVDKMVCILFFCEMGRDEVFKLIYKFTLAINDVQQREGEKKRNDKNDEGKKSFKLMTSTRSW